MTVRVPSVGATGNDLDHEARQRLAWVATDEPYQRLFRVRQARWRDAAGLPIGVHRGAPLGSRLAMPYARESLANYLTDGIRSVVRLEVVDRDRRLGKLFGEPRIFDDLLSSQPMCFNLFAELALDVALASRTFASLTGGAVADVTALDFEHSPGRGDVRFTGDRSAFDVFVEYISTAGQRGFVGIEVKYHESLKDRPGEHRARYDEVAAAMAVFRPDAAERLRAKPLQQVWRDHLLSGALIGDAASGFEEGAFVFLYPSENVRCAAAVDAYQGCLVEGCGSFLPWTLERVVAAIRDAGAGPWIDAFARRYLASV